jgi:nicotianamine synthase
MNWKELHKKITGLKTLTPNKEVNSTFHSLVSKVIENGEDSELTTGEINDLQRLASVAEYELELHWSELISRSKDPNKKIKEFPFYKNYLELTQLEWNSLEWCTKHRKHSVLFCGGGPLPMTAILLAEKHGVSSTIIDNDSFAVTSSKKLVSRLGLTKLINIEKADGATYQKYSEFNVVFVAALAGLELETKKRIFKSIYRNVLEGTHVIARSAHGNRKILYKPLPEYLYSMFKPVIEIRPFNDIINSIVILTV